MNNIKENKMGYMPVKRLLVTMSLPMMISMLVQALYNIVDSMFAAQFSENALAAVTFAFPMQNLMIAIASGTGVGVNAMLSKSLGEKNHERAGMAANTGVTLAVLSSLFMLVLGGFGAEAFMRSQTSNADIIADGTVYLRIVCCCSIGLFMQVMFERLLQSTGKTVFSMTSQLTGAIINIILDPIMIFGHLGFPEMGVAGAALATVVGQICASLVAIALNIKKNHEITLSIRSILRPHGAVVKRIYAVGVPSILMMSIGSVMTYMINVILEPFGISATNVFGAYFKLQSFFFMPVFGLNNGLIPILAFNYGSRSRERIKEALKFAAVLALAIMLVGTVIFNLFPGLLLSFFNASDEMHEIGEPALRIISLCFPVAAICIALGSTFQAFSQSIYSLLVSVIRQLVVLVPAAWLLSKTGIVTNIWWAFLIAEAAGLVCTLLFFRRLFRKTIETL